MAAFRQLAAIMFTDIVGYTALMGNDEQHAFSLLKKNRDLQKPLIAKYKGTWIKELGDGVLASFSTVTNAVGCAIEIQQSCRQIDGLALRIGIHLGEVLFENNDVFGDGVNIASRIQAMAPIGGIWISDAVYKTLVNNKNIQTAFASEVVLKNVKEPMRVYDVVFDLQTILSVRESLKQDLQSETANEKSIAVLPFVNMSNDPDQEFFSDGITEEIINSLFCLKDLKVAGRTSSFQFKGKNLDLREIGEKLGVNTILEGSVRKQGNRLRITAQLINVHDGFHYWSQRYDREMDDIFAIQDEIALSITEQLKIKLLDEDIQKITKVATRNMEAYECYLKGRFYINRRGSSILTGLNYFKQAFTLDDTYALAYAGYADANILSAGYSFHPGKEVMNIAREAADKAIILDPTLGEGYAALAYYYLCCGWNWEDARKSFLKAMELNPNYVQARSLYGMLYLAWIKGNFIEAEKQGLIAIKMEPLSTIDLADLAWTLHTAGRFEDALVYAEKAIEIDSNSFLGQRLAGLCYLALGRYDEAINTFQFLIRISNRHQHAINSLIWTYCSQGNFDAAGALISEMETRSKTEYIAGAFFGLSLAYFGRIDDAIMYLEKAYNDIDPMLASCWHSPYVPAILRADARFKDIMERMHFPG